MNRTDGINWFFAFKYKFKQIKMQWKIFGVGMVKNGCGEFGHGTLKLTVSQKHDPRLAKLKFNFTLISFIYSLFI